MDIVGFLGFVLLLLVALLSVVGAGIWKDYRRGPPSCVICGRDQAHRKFEMWICEPCERKYFK